jgi:NAD(P)-dependent dehydrogenase (short-subunit alcohol dehydrogenase family)
VDQVVVVFGATSAIGRATAVLAAARGARVVATGDDHEALVDLADEARDDELVTTVTDGADPAAVAAVVDVATTSYGRLDCWVHLAGDAELDRSDGGLVAPIARAWDALPALRADGGGSLVVVAPARDRALGRQRRLVDGLRSELRRDRVPVSVAHIRPSSVATPLGERARRLVGSRRGRPPLVHPPERVAAAILRAAEHRAGVRRLPLRPRSGVR